MHEKDPAGETRPWRLKRPVICVFLIATLPLACEHSSRCPDGRLPSPSGVCIVATDAAITDAERHDAGRGIEGGPVGCTNCAGECIENQCCDEHRVCAGACCAEDALCVFDECVPLGISCTTDEQCAAGEYCNNSFGGSDDICGSAMGRCVEEPRRCADGERPDPSRPSCISECRFDRSGAPFEIEERYFWGSRGISTSLNDARSSPIVIQLDDDDCDGRITARDIPEIVVSISPDDSRRPDGTNPIGDLVVLSVVGDELMEKTRLAGAVHPWGQLAAGNIDGLPGNEVVGCSPDRSAIRAWTFRDDELTLLWQSDPLTEPCWAPSLADLDQDSTVEVIDRGGVLVGADGEIRWEFPEPATGMVVVSDVDGDDAHRLEILSGASVLTVRGGELVPIARAPFGGLPIVVDLETGGRPEIVTVDATGPRFHVWHLNDEGEVEVLRRDVDIDGSFVPSSGCSTSGGNPTAGDVNGDGVPDIAIAAAASYTVFDGAALVDPARTNESTRLWQRETRDCSSGRTGSSVYDFNGDGRVEVLYNDEYTFRIYEGATGRSLYTTCNLNGTIWEMPVVADVDGDGKANIVVAANVVYARRGCLETPGSPVSGIRIYDSPHRDWTQTRNVWNQHAYHITNVEEDGTIPRVEVPNWQTPGLNNFRINVRSGFENTAPNAVLRLDPVCTGPRYPSVRITVRNLGQSVLPAGTPVQLFVGEAPTPALGEVVTTRGLFPGQFEQLYFANERLDLLGDPATAAPIRAMVNTDAELIECHLDDNEAVLTARCGID